jgi:hypothetical protein
LLAKEEREIILDLKLPFLLHAKELWPRAKDQ